MATRLFVIDDSREIRGFFGYSLAAQTDAEAWASGARNLTSEQCLAGDCLILNAWVAADRDTLAFMVRACRRLGRHKRALYFKRFYPNGTTRAACIVNNEIMARHIAHDHGDGETDAFASLD